MMCQLNLYRLSLYEEGDLERAAGLGVAGLLRQPHQNRRGAVRQGEEGLQPLYRRYFY
jgi:hypothetical protein